MNEAYLIVKIAKVMYCRAHVLCLALLIDIRDTSFKLCYIACVDQSFSRIYVRFGLQLYVWWGEPVRYYRLRWHLVVLPWKKVVYIIVLWWNIMPGFNLDQCTIQHLSLKLHMLAYKFCVRSCLIHWFICIAEKFVDYVIFNLYTGLWPEKKNWL